MIHDQIVKGISKVDKHLEDSYMANTVNGSEIR